MIQQTTTANIRIKKGFPLDSKYLNNSGGLNQTKYSQPFGKLFTEKNKERLSQVDTSVRSQKYSERYLINTNKLEKLGDNKQRSFVNQKSLMNRTLSNPNHQEFRITAPMFNLNRSSQSHRSHLFQVNLKQLPKLQSSSTFNGSHTKMCSLTQNVNLLCQETLNLMTATKDFGITLERTKFSLQSQCDDINRSMNKKIQQLQKLVNQVKSVNKQKSEQLKSNCKQIKQKNIQLKQYLQQIERKIEGIQNVLGVTTGHHKHYI